MSAQLLRHLAGCMVVGGYAAFTLMSCRSSLSAPALTNTSVPVSPSATLTAVPSPTATLPPTPTPSVVPADEPIIGPESYPSNVNPLTGLAVEDPSVLARRPLLIKISNAPPVVRPQSGISYADMMFEHYAEGGQTRFSALFYSEGVSHVGSVRSTRLIDLQLAPAYDAVLVFSGGSLGVIDTLRQSQLYPYNVISPQFGYGEPYFVRFPRKDLPFEHTLFSDTNTLWQWTKEKNVRQEPKFGAPGIAFRLTAPTGDSPARYARLRYIKTIVEWRYDALTGAYLRWTDGDPHRDALTGEQLAFPNVVVLSAYHEERVLFSEKYFGAEKSIYIELQGEGPATLLRDGQSYEGLWVRKGEKDMFSFVTPTGEPLYFKPGKTFMQIIRLGFEQLIVQP